MRTGKIARLPNEIREELNRRLADGEPGGSLLPWLNGLAPVRTVLTCLFRGVAISKQNLSEWRKGGFLEWKARQDLVSDVRQFSSDAQGLRDASGGRLTDDLATVLATQYALVLRGWKGRVDETLEARLRVLHGLCQDISALRQGDHNVAQLKFEWERLAFAKETRKVVGERDRPGRPGQRPAVQPGEIQEDEQGADAKRLREERGRDAYAGDRVDREPVEICRKGRNERFTDRQRQYKTESRHIASCKSGIFQQFHRDNPTAERGTEQSEPDGVKPGPTWSNEIFFQGSGIDGEDRNSRAAVIDAIGGGRNIGCRAICQQPKTSMFSASPRLNFVSP